MFGTVQTLFVLMGSIPYRQRQLLLPRIHVGENIMAFFNQIRKEVLELISTNEKIQSSILMERGLTPDEIEIIRMCAQQLLDIAPALRAERMVR